MFHSADVALQRIFDKRRGAWLYIAKTSAFSWIVVIMLLVAPMALGFATPREPDPEPPLNRFLDILVVPPLVENMVLVGLAEFFLTLELRHRTIVIVIALLAALVHGITDNWRAISGLIVFATMTYSYLHWYERRFSVRYFITVMQHVAFNTPAFVVLAYGQR